MEPHAPTPAEDPIVPFGNIGVTQPDPGRQGLYPEFVDGGLLPRRALRLRPSPLPAGLEC